MKYEDDFFVGYQQYLDNTDVQNTHEQIFNMLWSLFPGLMSSKVIDFGCGTAELGRYLYRHGHKEYIGVDIDVSRVNCPYGRFEVGDYNNYDIGNDVDVVASLFATEIHLPVKERDMLYNKWLASGVKVIFTSGFYYLGHEQDERITEETNITVYQNPITQPVRDDEVRICNHVHPGMFVNKFVEVWRIITA